MKNKRIISLLVSIVVFVGALALFTSTMEKEETVTNSIKEELIFEKTYKFDSENYDEVEESFEIKEAANYTLTISDIVQEKGSTVLVASIYDEGIEDYWYNTTTFLSKEEGNTFTYNVNLVPSNKYIIETYYNSENIYDTDAVQKGSYKITLKKTGPITSTKIKANVKNKKELSSFGQTVFKFTPKISGKYKFRWYDSDEEEEDMGMYEIFENMDKKVNIRRNTAYLKAGNDYYFIHNMHDCSKCITYLRVWKKII